MADRRTYRVRFQAPILPDIDRIEAYFNESRESRWFSNGGPCYDRLEARMTAELGGGVGVVPVSNATAGLMVAIRALAGKASTRRRIVTPSYTFVATASAILWAGFEPVFVDVDPEAWHIDPAAVRRAVEDIAEDVALILACSTFGVPQSDAVLSELRSIAGDLDAPLLVDSAAGFGSRLPDGSRRPVDGDVDVYSFHATKPFAVGEGGLVVTADPETKVRVKSLANFGFDERHIVGDEIGLNAKLDEWHCATALALLDDFDAVLHRRQASSRRVKAVLSKHGFTSQYGADLGSCQFIPLLAPNQRVRAKCLHIGRERGIELRDYYRQPLHDMPALRKYSAADKLPVTADLASRALSLPLANDMSDADLDEVIEVCMDAAKTPSD